MFCKFLFEASVWNPSLASYIFACIDLKIWESLQNVKKIRLFVIDKIFVAWSFVDQLEVVKKNQNVNILTTCYQIHVVSLLYSNVKVDLILWVFWGKDRSSTMVLKAAKMLFFGRSRKKKSIQRARKVFFGFFLRWDNVEGFSESSCVVQQWNYRQTPIFVLVLEGGATIYPQNFVIFQKITISFPSFFRLWVWLLAVKKWKV